MATKYDDEFRQKALELSDKIGNKKAAEQLNMNLKTIDYWRMVRKRAEEKGKKEPDKKESVKKEPAIKEEMVTEKIDVKPSVKKDNRLFKRGDIYYVAQKAPTGCEISKGRPAVIVSNNRINNNMNTIEVVYLTTKERIESPEHVYIASSGVDSTAVCEQVSTVDKSRIERYIGSCTIEEIENIENGILHSLQMENRTVKEEVAPANKTVINDGNEEHSKTENNVYKMMFEAIIEKLVNMNR